MKDATTPLRIVMALAVGITLGCDSGNDPDDPKGENSPSDSGKGTGEEQGLVVTREPKPLTPEEARTKLEDRNHTLEDQDGGLLVGISPGTESQEVTPSDIRAINALKNVVEIRVIADPGISERVFKGFREYPELKTFGVHYDMPAGSLVFLDKKFPNIEKLEFWGSDISFDQLPPLEKLRVLDDDSNGATGRSIEEVKRIAASKNLEQVTIRRSIPEEGINQLKELPNLKLLIVEGKAIVGEAPKPESNE